MAVKEEHVRAVRERFTEELADRSAASAAELILAADSEATPVLSIVLPTLNEEAGIRECMERIHRAVEAMGIQTEIIVSDSSTDRTPEIAREYGAIVLEPDEDGYGAAYQYAFERARGEFIAMADADCTYDFEELPKLLSVALNEDADIVLGSRLNGEIRPGAMPALHRYVGNPLLTTFLNTFYGAGVSDAHSGYRILTREAIETLSLNTTGMEFASEMIMEAGSRGLTIKEVPITYHEREGEATLDSFRDGWRHVRFMLLNAPGYLFSIPGALMTLVGVFVLSAAVLDGRIGSMGFGPHSAIAGSLLTIVGTQVMGLGAFAKVTGNPIRTRRDPLTEFVLERVSLEHGATLGLLLVGGGAAYVVLMLGRWVASGYTQLPLLMGDIAAMTAMVLGIQVIFLSFYLSAVATE